MSLIKVRKIATLDSEAKDAVARNAAINAAKGRMIEAMRKTIVDAVKKRAKQ